MRRASVHAAGALSIALVFVTRSTSGRRPECLPPPVVETEPPAEPLVVEPAPFWFEAEPVREIPGPVVVPEPARQVAEPVVPAPAVVVAPVVPAPSVIPEPVVRVPVVMAPDPPVRRRPPPEPRWAWREAWDFELSPEPTPQQRPATPARRRPRIDLRYPALGLALLALIAAVLVVLPRSPSASARPEHPTLRLTPRPSVYALRTIPPRYLALYARAAREYGLDWTKLAAVGRIESDHGRSPLPGVLSGTNSSGAAGPAQFRAGTWARYGVDADGQGAINPYDPADAITAMAAFLKAAGAPDRWQQALYAYNDSALYVRQALALSQRFVAAH